MGEMGQPHPLMTAYLERREDMRRFFLARLGPRADIDDLLQDLFVKVRDIAADDIQNPAAYLYRLASNLMLDKLRATRRGLARDAEWRRSHHASIGALDVANEPDAEAGVIARQRLERLKAALETLAPATRKAFQLHKFEGLSHSETATQMGISRSAVEKHVSLALKHLLVRVGR